MSHCHSKLHSGSALLVALCLSTATMGQADPCYDEIVALFDNGPLDPFVQPPYRYETTVYDASGAIKFEYITTFDTPMRAMNRLKGQTVYLSINRQTWSAPGPDGPWTELPSSLPEDLEAFHKANRDALAQNLTEAECLGHVEKDGQSLLAYRYETQTGPNFDGTYFGATYTSYIDPTTNRLILQEEHKAFAHYQPEGGTDVTIKRYTYDGDFKLSAPD
ncbi:hypothetical protein [Thalassococcus lentus]|uniref:Secreted protein n=1 Tax=Thalassococcus lentus TaxID=1210524 RepID=A0ABT4XT05_9RHOB|nr:hypothetical protein [Thalassococcus lentus]MDA7425071.1 hypothetical protein [Thalassococcus lentus]